MVKLSESTPAFSALLQRLCAQTFAPEEVCIATGGPEVAAQFSALPFDHLLFTGSAPVGRKVMAAAASNLTPVTLELGGKSPAVVTPGYPLAHAVQRILTGKLLNAGQTCVAPDYVLLPREQLAAFVEAARRHARRSHPAGLADRDFCSIVDDRHYRRLVRDIDEAAERGARVECLFDGAARDDARHRLAPTLLVDPPADCRAMRDEIFGPVLPLVPYDRLDDAMAFIGARPHPLALYWFDRDRARVEQALRTLPAGGVTVNDTLLHVAQESLPFGGVGASGMGHYHGRWGFDTFSKLTPVLRQSRFNGMALFLPPYRPTMRRLLGWMKRF
jgi:coniferyl-aldehyde dehydrogenase